VRQIACDDVGGLFEAREALGKGHHESAHAFRAGDFDARRHVDQDDGGRDPGSFTFAISAVMPPSEAPTTTGRQGTSLQRRAGRQRRRRWYSRRRRPNLLSPWPRASSEMAYQPARAMARPVPRRNDASGHRPAEARRGRQSGLPGIAGERDAGVADESDGLVRRDHWALVWDARCLCKPMCFV